MTEPIRAIRVFDGPNVWCRAPVTWLLIDDGGATAPIHRIREALESLRDPTTTARPVESLPWRDAGTKAELIGQIAIELQRRAGFSVSFHSARTLPGGRADELVVEHEYAEVGLAACRLAVAAIGAATGEEPAVAGKLADRFWHVAAPRRKVGFGGMLISAAKARDIPVSMIDPSARIVELGTGAYRKRFHDSITSSTSKLGHLIASDKHLAGEILGAAGLPVAGRRLVRSAEQAVAAARQLGYPVVLKPNSGGASYGVAVDVRTEEELRARFSETHAAAGASELVLVEQYVTGRDYRVSVAGDVVFVYENRPIALYGDGRSSILELIGFENADPRRGTSEAFPLSPIVVDEQAMLDLRRLGYDVETIPAKGERLELRPVGKIADGWVSVDCTDMAHPENLALFRMAVDMLELDVASLDVVADDIAKPIWETSGAIIEVNVGSIFRNELYPGEGQARDIAPVVLDRLFAPGDRTRAFVIAVIGDDVDDLCEAIADELERDGWAVGRAYGAEVRVGRNRMREGDYACVAGARMVLSNPGTEVAVIAVTAQRIVEEGLGFDACDVAVVGDRSGLTTPAGEPVESVVTSLCPEGGLIVYEPGNENVLVRRVCALAGVRQVESTR